MNTLSRRTFLAASGLTAAGLVTGLGTQLVLAAPGATANGGDKLVVIFLRGGADGLTMAPPYGYASYRQLRPTIAVPPPGQAGGALPLTAASAGGRAAFPTGLDGVVGLHPAFAPIHETLWSQGQLAVIVGTGLPNSSRSHFSAQEYVQRGDSVGVSGGWLGRVVDATPSSGPVSSVFSNRGDRILVPSPTRMGLVGNLGGFGLTGFGRKPEATAALRAFSGGNDSVSTEGRRLLDLAGRVNALDAKLRPGYPAKNGYASALSEVSTLFQSDLGVQAAVVNQNGWDHHNDLPNRMSKLIAELAAGLRAFADDTSLTGITVLVMTEFGRTINENGSQGTDHGRAATYLAMGAGIQGGVFGDDYPDQLSLDGAARGDMAVMTDFRKPVSEIIQRRVLIDPGPVFPTYTQQAPLGLARQG